jgi:hypothetical protein
MPPAREWFLPNCPLRLKGGMKKLEEPIDTRTILFNCVTGLLLSNSGEVDPSDANGIFGTIAI